MVLSSDLNKIKVDIVSDIVCPWCVIGSRRLYMAIDSLNLKDKVDVNWQPFQLNPTLSDDGDDLTTILMEKYNMTEKELQLLRSQMIERGKELGFTYNYTKGIRTYNTYKAHLLLHWTQNSIYQDQLSQELFTAFFTYNRDISDTNVLLELVSSIGLDSDEAKEVLEDSDMNQTLEEIIEKWKASGIQGVPTMIFNNKKIVSGAQTVSKYEKILSDLI